MVKCAHDRSRCRHRIRFDRSGDRPACEYRQARRGGRPAAGERRPRRGSDARRGIRRDDSRHRCFLARVGARARGDRGRARRHHGRDPRGRRVTESGLPSHHPRGRPVRYRARARGVRERNRAGWGGSRHRVAVGTPAARAHRRTGRRARDHTVRPTSAAPHAPGRPGDRLTQRLPARQARELVAGDGRSRPLGQARCPDQHDQSRHRLHAVGPRRTERSTRRGIPAHDRTLSCRARRHPRRGRDSRRAARWAPMVLSSPAATFSSTAASPRLISTASSPRNSSILECPNQEQQP